MRVAVTGANGFLGHALCIELMIRFDVLALVRELPKNQIVGVEYIVIGDLTTSRLPNDLLKDVDVVIHTAARAHVIKETERDSSDAYRKVNVVGTQKLITSAIECGVRRFIFVSSIKVNGEKTSEIFQESVIAEVTKTKFSFDDNPAPEDAYGASKWEAEMVLWERSRVTNIEIVVVRPPLIYGPCIKGNLARLIKLISLGMPAPFGSINNRRSFVGLDNLIDLLVCCISHPQAAGQTFLVSDGHDLSTPELMCAVGKAMGRSVRLFPLPVWLLKILASVFGMKTEIDRLCGSLVIDIAYTRERLGWVPPISLAEGMSRMFRKAKAE